MCLSPRYKLSGAVVWAEADVPTYSFLRYFTRLCTVWRIRARALKGWKEVREKASLKAGAACLAEVLGWLSVWEMGRQDFSVLSSATALLRSEHNNVCR